MKKVLKFLVFLLLIVFSFSILTKEEYEAQTSNVSFQTLPYEEYVDFAKMYDETHETHNLKEKKFLFKSNENESVHSNSNAYAEENKKALEEYERKKQEYIESQKSEDN